MDAYAMGLTAGLVKAAAGERGFLRMLSRMLQRQSRMAGQLQGRTPRGAMMRGSAPLIRRGAQSLGQASTLAARQKPTLESTLASMAGGTLGGLLPERINPSSRGVALRQLGLLR